MPTVERHAGAFLIHGRNYGKDGLLVQTDWDYPAVARELGWNMKRVQPAKPVKGYEGRMQPARILQRAPANGCDHRSTDGTVNCECGVAASDFIYAAANYLDNY